MITVCFAEGPGSLRGSDQSPEKLGFDTLDELAEKNKFFQVSYQFETNQ